MFKLVADKDKFGQEHASKSIYTFLVYPSFQSRDSVASLLIGACPGVGSSRCPVTLRRVSSSPHLHRPAPSWKWRQLHVLGLMRTSGVS